MISTRSWKFGGCSKIIHRAHLLPQRDLSPCTPWALHNGAFSTGRAEIPRSKKTRKKLSDLPTGYISPLGTPASALPEWISGDEATCKIANKIRSSDTAASKQDPGGNAIRKSPQNSENSESTTLETNEPSGLASPAENVTCAKAILKTTKSGTFLAREILANLERFPNCLLLTKVGQFYESYFDQAVEISSLLNIKLTSRKWNGERVAMCGFPLLHLDRHLKVLVKQERRFVAMCEEFPRHTAQGTKEFERRVARIITPGTLIDESFLNPFDNNFLLAISPAKNDTTSNPTAGLAWIDVSTGELFSENCTLENLQDQIARISPQEVVLDDAFRQIPVHPVVTILAANSYTISYSSILGSRESRYEEPSSILKPANSANEEMVPQGAFATSNVEHRCAWVSRESSAIKLLAAYLQKNLLEHMPLLPPPCQGDDHQRMQIDCHTVKGLEIRENTHDGGTKGSLLSVIKRTVTCGGSRLLARWLCSPSTSIEEITTRQSVVTFFRHRPHFRTDIVKTLKQLEDVGRISQRFLLGRAEVSDLLAIHTTICIWAKLMRLFPHEKSLELTERSCGVVERDWNRIEELLSPMSPLQNLGTMISNAVIFPTGLVGRLASTEVEETETEQSDWNSNLLPGYSQRWLINPDYSPRLILLHSKLQTLLKTKEEMETDLQSRYDAPSLTLRSSPGQGIFVHLTKAKRDRKLLDFDPCFCSIGETVTTKSYFYKEWTCLSNDISETTNSLVLAEKEAFEELRQAVIEQCPGLRTNTSIVDELDVYISFAALAAELNFVCPEIVDDGTYHVVDGRHPAVELGLLSSGRSFTPNSVEMKPSSTLHVITGPNMAGKSTFLRQTALIAILAQTGSFVPANFARIGIVDRLFSRIGAQDDLSRDRSTFMVEMLETADILRRATPKSMVIMDEVGRGTTVEDGLAIAFATLHHLAAVNKSRCLFATHFHELSELMGMHDDVSGQGVFENVQFYCSSLAKGDDSMVTYSYRLKPGINRDSHGLKVAQLAGMPPAAMAIAQTTLTALRQREHKA